jgi:hypothetical protein
MPSASAGDRHLESKNNSNGGSFMNKLLKPALMAFTAVLTTVLASCSGSDGKSGNSGDPGKWETANCEAVLSGDGTEVAIVCDGVEYGVLARGDVGPGGEPGSTGGTCDAVAGDGGWVVKCDGRPDIFIQNGTGTGGCILGVDTERGAPANVFGDWLTIDCGVRSFSLSLCGDTASAATAKPQTFNNATHFCSSELATNAADKGAGERTVPRCGIPAAGSRDSGAYDVSTLYCARNLVLSLAHRDFYTDALDSAVYSDLDSLKPHGSNWKALPKEICFAINGSRAVSDSCAAFSVEGPTITSKYKVQSGDTLMEYLGAFPRCGHSKFYDLATNKCISPDGASKADTNCAATVEGSNACYSTLPSPEPNNLRLKACNSEGDADSTYGVKYSTKGSGRVWYTARSGNVKACNANRKALDLAIECSGSAASAKIISSKWVGEGYDGSSYYKKVACYTVSDPTGCASGNGTFESAAGSALKGTCKLAPADTMVTCPTNYSLSNKAAFTTACENFIKGVGGTGATTDIYPVLTANRSNAVLDTFFAGFDFIRTMIDSSGKTNATNRQTALKNLAEDFGKACVRDSSGSGASVKVYECGGAWQAWRKTGDPGKRLWQGSLGGSAADTVKSAIIDTLLAEVCRGFKAAYDSTASSYCVRNVAQANCPSGSTAYPFNGTCTLNETGSSIAVPAPVAVFTNSSGGTNRATYTRIGNTAGYQADVIDAMCPMGFFDKKTNLCSVRETDWNPACYPGYLRNELGYYCYKEANMDCDPEYSWDNIAKTCMKGDDELQPRCQSGTYYSKSDAETATKPDYAGRCVDGFTNKNCFIGTQLVNDTTVTTRGSGATAVSDTVVKKVCAYPAGSAPDPTCHGTIAADKYKSTGDSAGKCFIDLKKGVYTASTGAIKLDTTIAADSIAKGNGQYLCATGNTGVNKVYRQIGTGPDYDIACVPFGDALRTTTEITSITGSADFCATAGYADAAYTVLTETAPSPAAGLTFNGAATPNWKACGIENRANTTGDARLCLYNAGKDSTAWKATPKVLECSTGKVDRFGTGCEKSDATITKRSLTNCVMKEEYTHPSACATGATYNSDSRKCEAL